MEAFSLLKFWRPGAAPAAVTADTKTVLAAAAAASFEDEDGPYIDLNFLLPDQELHKKQTDEETDSGTENEVHENEDEVKFVDCFTEDFDSDAVSSPSDEVLVKGEFVPIEPTAILVDGTEEEEEEEASKSPLLFTKFRVFLLKLAKPKSSGEKSNGKFAGKLFAVKLKIDEAPIISLFNREKNSKEKQKQQQPDESPADERKLIKEVVQKYIKMVKPFQIRVPRKLAGVSEPSCPGEKSGNSETPNLKKIQMGNSNLQAGIKVVRKHFGKSGSGNCSIAATPRLRMDGDDSLLQLEEGIQGAILHCKRSFNATKDGESSSSSSQDKFVTIPRNTKESTACGEAREAHSESCS